MEGWGGFVLKKKLKMLKADLKGWNREVFGCINSKIVEKKQEMEALDHIDDTLSLEDDEIIARNRISGSA